MKRSFILIIAICFVLSDSCNKDEQSESVIEPDFQEYVDRFVCEADSRNIKIDISKLKVSYGDTLVFYCGYGMPNDVVIKSSCWKDYTDMQKEVLLFHELGHAVLGRIHNNDKLPNGDYFTIMTSRDFSSCYSEYTPEKRKYYLDKLFNSDTPLPDWAQLKTVPTVIFKDTIQSGSTLWQFINGPGNSSSGKFCSTQYFSSGTCLSIEPSSNIQGWAYWNLNYIPQSINQSDKLVFRAMIKTAGVPKEGGVTLILGGKDSNNKSVFWNFAWISGSNDFTERVVEIPYYVSAQTIYIRFVFGDNPGTAYLDDVTLTKYESQK